ncbi:MAG: 3-deoxy-manno-octulosonate cytidylyltransferase [Calditrichaeota bacterium]|nr:3-deoxy-manno-octulosonate cytidylyltransferase [Calditrichota bacterium]
MTSEAIVIIPARYGAARLPGKPLIPIASKPLIQWVYERATRIPGIHSVIVATDHPEIQQAIQQIGGIALLTPDHFQNGSERVAWVARELDADIVVNLQGDEPLVDTEAVGQAVAFLRLYPDVQVATLSCELTDPRDWQNPNVVKVLVDERNFALYFSRQPLPYFREGNFYPLPNVRRHVGVYVFRRKFLLEYSQWPPGHLEQAERLEQLRILEKGVAIKVIPAAYCSPGVDTPEDVTRIENRLKAEGSLS